MLPADGSTRARLCGKRNSASIKVCVRASARHMVRSLARAASKISSAVGARALAADEEHNEDDTARLKQRHDAPRAAAALPRRDPGEARGGEGRKRPRRELAQHRRVDRHDQDPRPVAQEREQRERRRVAKKRETGLRFTDGKLERIDAGSLSPTSFQELLADDTRGTPRPAEPHRRGI